MARILGWVLLVLMLACAGAALLVWRGVIVVPAAYDPWAALDLRAEPNLLTRFKLSRLESRPEKCRAVLGGADLRFTPVPNRTGEAGCGLDGAIRVSRTQVAFSSAFVATCPLAAAWILFETHVLQAAAERHLGQRVVRVQHLGTYACRNLYGRPEGRRSEHATANAIDIAGVVLEDGSTVTLPRDWDGPDARRAAFLRDVRDGACRFFDVVLGPDYNQAHRDHFHLDMGGGRACR